MAFLKPRWLCAAASAALLVMALVGPAAAATQDPTFLSMSSGTGDYIGQGQSYYFTPATATFTPTYDGSLARFAVITPGYGEWWYVTIAAAPGQPLVAGTYANAVRAEFRGAGQPGLDVWGDGRGCNTVSGSFTVLRALYAADNTVLQFDATFVQNCEGFMPALTGEIRYDATPPLAPKVTIAAGGTVSKRDALTTVSGTISCSVPATATVSGKVTEALKKGTASASFAASVACTIAPTTWTAAVRSSTGRAFAAGAAQVSVTAVATDALSGQSATITAAAPVKLTLVR